MKTGTIYHPEKAKPDLEGFARVLGCKVEAIAEYSVEEHAEPPSTWVAPGEFWCLPVRFDKDISTENEPVICDEQVLYFDDWDQILKDHKEEQETV